MQNGSVSRRVLTSGRVAVWARGLMAGLAGLSVLAPTMAADAAPGGTPTAAAPATAGAPQPTKVAVIFLEKIQSGSDRRKEIQTELEQRTAQLKEKQQTLMKVMQSMDEVDKNMRQGIGGDMSQMQERWLALAKQRFQMEAELKDQAYRVKKEFAQKVVALKTDISNAIAQVAKREGIDIVIIRKDAEQAAVETEKAKNDLLGKKNPDEKPDTGDRNKLEKELDHEMTQKMLSKLENTFVWSNDAMDITAAVVQQLGDNFKSRAITAWDQIKLPDEGPDGAAGPGGPAGLPEE
ncbi:MAG TPA: hypothetical protein VL860_03145 [Planctomycetota bacterium]|nr:hypothetical protein [Planctomycetota bacterium]